MLDKNCNIDNIDKFLNYLHLKLFYMNCLKRMYMQYMAKKGKFSEGIVIGLCEIYEYETDEKKVWQAEMAWSLQWCGAEGQTSEKELRRILRIFFINHAFVDDKIVAHILSNRRRVLPLFMACLKKRKLALTKEESKVISHLATEDFKRLCKPLHPWIEKELLTSGDAAKIKWYCRRFVLSSDAEMHLLLLATQKNYREAARRDFDYASLLSAYVCEHKSAFDNDCAYDFLLKQEGLTALKKIVMSRRAGE